MQNDRRTIDAIDVSSEQRVGLKRADMLAMVEAPAMVAAEAITKRRRGRPPTGRKTRIHLALRPELAERLKDRAAQGERTIVDLITSMIEHALDNGY